MKILPHIVVGLALTCSCVQSNAQSSIDCFLRIDGIKGESTSQHHEEWIELLSFQFSLSNPVGGSGGGSGRAQFGELGVSKRVDAASSGLMEACAKGDPIKEVNLVCSRNGMDYYRIRLKDVVVTSLQPGWEEGGKSSTPTEEVTFHYNQIQWEYSPQKHDGSLGAALKGGWDLKTGRTAP